MADNDADQRQEFAKMLSRVAYLFELLLDEHGASNNAVGWSHPDVHKQSIQTLLRLIEPQGREDLTINDFGCGYGLLFEFIRNEPWFKNGAYYGYDINESMATEVIHRYGRDGRVHAAQTMEPYWEADYSIAAGTFNCSLQAPEKDWLELIAVSLYWLWNMSKKGMAVSFLNQEWKVKDPDLIYLDPGEWLAWCQQNFSQNCVLIENEPKGQFALLIYR